MSNNYNYENHTLASGSPTEHLVREGYLENESGLHTPRTMMNLSADDLIEYDEEGEVIRSFEYEPAENAIWERIEPYGRHYIGYDGLYRVEFLPGYQEEALTYRRELAFERNIRDFIEEETTSHRITYTFNKETTARLLTDTGLDIDSLRNQFDSVSENPLSVTAMKENVAGETIAPLMDMDLETFLKRRQAMEDNRLFTSLKENQVDRYFGGQNTGVDVGFYTDKSGRIRATYDAFMIYRSKPLVEDLLNYAEENEYAVGYFPNTKAIQFVLSKPLSERFIERYFSYSNLATRWNNKNTTPSNFDPTKLGVFESIINVDTKALIDAVDIFGFTAKEGVVDSPK